MNNIVILDTETTGLDVTKGQVIEIGAIFYNIPHRNILAQCSTLIYAEDNAAYEVNRIEVDLIKSHNPIVELFSIETLISMISNADAILAHNAEFDKKWIETIPRFKIISESKKWICTRNDVVWPIRKGCALNLIHICADLGVPIINAHRALDDCHLLVGALSKIDDIEYFLDKSGKGRLRYDADISYDQRQLAKDAGFQWDNTKKVWYTKITPDDAALLPFTVYPAEKNLNNNCI